jgi:NitT/TauT family transport system substrate-binding protein
MIGMLARCGGAALAAGACLAVSIAVATAQEALRVAVGGRGPLHLALSELGERQGLFRGRDLALRTLADGREALAAVIAGTADLGVGIATVAALRAFADGAPIRIVGSARLGSDAFWYVSARSPIRTLKDAAGRRAAHDGAGTASRLAWLALQEQHAVKLVGVAAPDPVAALAQVLGGRLDVGWSVPPVGAAELADGRIRIIARADDLPGLAGRTTRVLVAGAATLAGRGEAIRRYLEGCRATLDWLFSADPAALTAYAGWAGIKEAQAPGMREALTPKASLAPERVARIDALIADALASGALAAPPGAEALRTLIQAPPAER